MTVYVAMLRGINVGGNKRIKMDTLRHSFEALGFEQVRTFIQSGNVVFKTRKLSTSALSKTIETRLLDDFGFPVSVVSRTADEFSQAIEKNPFAIESGLDQEKLHIMFLSEAPSSAAMKKVELLAMPPDRFHWNEKEIFLYLPNGVAESALMKRPLDRLLSVVSTTRNWKTVNSIHRMCRDCRG